jgi:hypothetical protein
MMTMLWEGQWPYPYVPLSGLSRFLRLPAYSRNILQIKCVMGSKWTLQKRLVVFKICILNLPDRFVREAFKPDIEGGGELIK